MPIADSLVSLAGFAFAHAAWSVSDLPKGELLVPLAIVEKSGQRQLLRFEAESQERAITEGKATLARHEQDLDAWVLVREGQIREGEAFADVLTVEAKSAGEVESIVFVQRFQPFATGVFKLLGSPQVAVGGRALSEVEAKPFLAQLYAGVQSHSKAMEHWQQWSAP